MKSILLSILVLCIAISVKAQNINAADYGFLPTASGMDNQKALQKAADNGGTIVIDQPGEYLLGGTVYLGSNTSLIFGNNVKIKKDASNGKFTHVFLNKGALTKTYNEHISIEGLNLIVNGVDQQRKEVYGLRGQVAFSISKIYASSTSDVTTWNRHNSAFTSVHLKTSW